MKCIILKDGIALKGHRIMKNKLLIVSLLRKARKSQFPKQNCVTMIIIAIAIILNSYCAQYFILIITHPQKCRRDVTVRDKIAVWEAERSD